MIRIIKASEEHIALIVPLFDDYRIFYDQDSDKERASLFLEKRLKSDESIIFLVLDDDVPIGFTQLYTTFSSVSMESFYILNDLYVLSKFRGKGVGESLLERAKEQCKLMNYKGLALETSVNNPAQHLYERLDWKKDIEHFRYFWSSPKN
ncbi:GNAT family N-acetyltransferase [Croceitalea sp. MTPC9]|uniref:GNAT family N-acetyltransferase n=1 Tax=unclassified Croceitalea TaxID=2632280 RepID=UPI002B3CB832|nr:GNAT family N-acetyltransferase [Croceitalea sp. MTPC6]GMN15462.1 GNAT family N-acetyltransferase [Croceitalea sp. MTPC9]